MQPATGVVDAATGAATRAATGAAAHGPARAGAESVSHVDDHLGTATDASCERR